MAVVLTRAYRKQLGAYYTGENVARFLLEASLVSKHERILEPCFGDGVFIDAWHQLTHGQTRGVMVGCDIAGDVVADVRLRYPETSLYHADFFNVLPGQLGRFDLVVGNPPFVRYHRLSKTSQNLALHRAEQAGVSLPPLTSIWVPFLLHATQHLAVGGRLGVVAPLELTYARYAKPFREYLCRHFGSVRIIMFDKPLFPHLNQSAVLVLARDWGGQSQHVDVIHARDISDLSPETIWALPARRLQPSDWQGEERQSQHLRLTPVAQTLYDELTELATPLGDLARITIGYVTGNNKWFHLAADEVTRLGLTDDVRLAIRRGSDLRKCGLTMNAADRWCLSEQGAHWLFSPLEPLSPAAQSWIQKGEQLGVQSAYKCRVRSPWWKVPGVRPHHFTIGVLSTNGPRLVATDLPATNSLLVGDLTANVEARVMAAAALTSLASLSAEVVGHPLGGGALKMEPAEARRWLLPVIDNVDDGELDQIDEALKRGNSTQAAELADSLFLRSGLGLSRSDILLLQKWTQELRRWRMGFR